MINHLYIPDFEFCKKSHGLIITTCSQIRWGRVEFMELLIVALALIVILVLAKGGSSKRNK
jgi:hypothetical protein